MNEIPMWFVISVVAGHFRFIPVLILYLLAAACAQFPLPVITGIGHERDDTVLDSVAHTRVKTPTAAAELLIYRVTEIADRLEELSARIQQGAYAMLEQEWRRLETLQTRIPNLVHRILTDARFALLSAGKDLSQVTKALLARQHHRLELLQQRIADASPDKLLSRGYSITLKDGKAVTDASSLKQGDKLVTRFLERRSPFCGGIANIRIEVKETFIINH